MKAVKAEIDDTLVTVMMSKGLDTTKCVRVKENRPSAHWLETKTQRLVGLQRAKLPDRSIEVKRPSPARSRWNQPSVNTVSAPWIEVGWLSALRSEWEQPVIWSLGVEKGHQPSVSRGMARDIIPGD